MCTMSPQVTLIKQTLLLALPVAASLVVIGGRSSEIYLAEGDTLERLSVTLPSSAELGGVRGRKKKHVSLACAHYGIESYSQVLLIDDDQVLSTL